jgi:hypothetical protein
MLSKLSDAGKVALAIIVAGLIIAIALYLKPVPGRYTFSVRGSSV